VDDAISILDMAAANIRRGTLDAALSLSAQNQPRLSA